MSSLVNRVPCVAEFALGAGIVATSLGSVFTAAAWGAAQPNVILPAVSFVLGGILITLGLQQARRDRSHQLILVAAARSPRSMIGAPNVPANKLHDRDRCTLDASRRAAMAWVEQLALPSGCSQP